MYQEPEVPFLEAPSRAATELASSAPTMVESQMKSESPTKRLQTISEP